MILLEIFSGADINTRRLTWVQISGIHYRPWVIKSTSWIKLTFKAKKENKIENNCVFVLLFYLKLALYKFRVKHMSLP